MIVGPSCLDLFLACIVVIILVNLFGVFTVPTLIGIVLIYFIFLS